MSKRFVKFMSFILVLMMIVSIFVGCAKNKETQDSTTKAESKKTEVTTTEGTTKEETTKEGTTLEETTVEETTVEETTEVFVPQKDIELVIWQSHGTDIQAVDKPKIDIPGDWLAEKTKVRPVEYFGNGGTDWGPKLTTMVAGDTIPDVVLMHAAGKAVFTMLNEGDLVWELTPELLQKYAPEYWKRVSEYEWNLLKVDGKILALPQGLGFDPDVDADFITAFSLPAETVTWNGMVGQSTNCLGIRDDVLKQLIPEAMNYEEAMALIDKERRALGDEFVLPIKTTEEYIKFMYDIQDLGLTVGNKPVYATGYNGGDNWLALSVLGAEMMGYKNYYYTGYLNIPQKRMDFGYLDPLFGAAAKIQSQMIRDKVIDPESLVHNAEKYIEKVMNGQYAIFGMAWTGQSFDSINSELEKQGKSFRILPFYTQVPNTPEFPHYQEGPTAFTSSISILKTVTEEELPQVLNWLNTMFTEEWEEISYWGTEEAGLYEVMADGKRKFKDENLQKFLVEGDMTVMDWTDAKGLNYNNVPFSGGSPGLIFPLNKYYKASIYNPRYIYQELSYTSLNNCLKFSALSKWVTDFVQVPNIQAWAGEYGHLDEIQELWAKRAVWDDPFKIALTAKSDDEFDQKWSAAIENLEKTIDIKSMLDKQTEIMTPLWDLRKTEND